jgi:hypothetical protein
MPDPVRAVMAARDWRSLAAAATTALGTAPTAPPVPAPRSASQRREPVVLRMTGGLGNQMFQYAAARAYAHRVGAELLLDLEQYERRGARREFLLSRLRADVRTASLPDVARALRRSHMAPPGRLDADLIEGRPGLEWLTGYWEHPAHFAGFEAEVADWFRPRDPTLEARARARVEALRAPGRVVVGVHVRRGDRVQERPGAVPHRAVPLEYYRSAVAQFSADSVFLCFSDSPPDVAWCRDHLGLPADRAAYSDGVDPVFDLVAMAACDHLVLAASTLSWWAAWLGARPGRRVVTPDPTAGSGPAQMDLDGPTRALAEWTVIPFPPPDRGLLRHRRT